MRTVQSITPALCLPFTATVPLSAQVETDPALDVASHIAWLKQLTLYEM